jgi:cbb3-type cytochrome oxidase subunit 1
MGWRWHRGRLVTDEEFYREEQEAILGARKLIGFFAMWAFSLFTILLIITLFLGETPSKKFIEVVAFLSLIPAYIFRSLGWKLFVIGIVIISIKVIFFK